MNTNDFYLIYKDNAPEFNSYLFLLLIILNVFDIGLTFTGIEYFGFGEGNCYFEKSVEAGNYAPIILFKSIILSVLFFMLIFAKRVDNLPFNKFLSLGLIFLVGIYLFTVIHWFLGIGWAIIETYLY